MGSVFSSLKITSLRDLAGLFSQKGLALLAFLLIFFVFILNTSLCPEAKMKKYKTTTGSLEDKLIPGEEDIHENDSLIDQMCRLKSSLTTNVVVVFLVLTVVRQVMIKVQSARDRIR